MDVKTKHDKYASYKTRRQWASEGFLPKKSAKGVKLWNNRYCQVSSIYYAPNEVFKASPKQIKKHFAPEREAARLRKERRLEEEKRIDEDYQRSLFIEDITGPYKERIADLQKMLNTKTADISSSYTGPIVIDIKTTGLDYISDEILHVGIITVDDKVLFNSKFQPFVKSWKTEESVMGKITPSTVENAPRFSSSAYEIKSIISSASTIVCYNPDYVLGFLRSHGILPSPNATIINVIQDFANSYPHREWNDFYGGYRYQTLRTAAKYYCYDWESHPNDEMANAFAINHVYQRMYCKN